LTTDAKDGIVYI